MIEHALLSKFFDTLTLLCQVSIMAKALTLNFQHGCEEFKNF